MKKIQTASSKADAKKISIEEELSNLTVKQKELDIKLDKLKSKKMKMESAKG
jgi:hypothetical protein